MTRAAFLAALLVIACAPNRAHVHNDPDSYRSICTTWDGEPQAEACYELAVQYLAGNDVPRDPAIAAQYLDTACKGRGLAVPHACRTLGDLHVAGDGVEQDYERAAKLFELACSVGDGPSCTKAGAMIDDAPRMPGEPVRAFQFYLQACTANDAEGCLLAGTALARGKGTTANTAHAKTSFEKACRLGNADACAIVHP